MKLNNKGGSPESERNCHKKEKELRDSDCEYWYQKGLEASKEKIEELRLKSNGYIWNGVKNEMDFLVDKINEIIREVNKLK